MVRRILVPVDPSEYTETAIEVACRVAKEQSAEVTVFGVVDRPGIERAEGGAPAGAIYYAEKAIEHRIDEARKTIMELFAKFRTICEKHGVPHRELEVESDPVDALLDESRYHDLVVTGLRSSLHFATEEKPEKNLDELLHHTITPILAVPKEPPPLRRALICYDGSLPAARSLQRFAHLAFVPQMEVKLLVATEQEDRGLRLLERAAEYLAAYGARSVEKVVEKGDVNEVVRRHLGESDVVVLGVHSRVPVLDFVVGSLTKTLIRSAEVALFMSQ